MITLPKPFVTSIFLLFLAVLASWQCKKPDKVLFFDPEQKQLEIFGNSPQSQSLQAHMRALNAFGDSADLHYKESLSRIRADSTIHIEIISTYQRVPENLYYARAQLILTLSDLETDASLDGLYSIASRVPGAEKSKDPEYSTRAQESIISTTATEGISQLAMKGNETAFRHLNTLVNSEDITVRQMAIRGILTSQLGGEEQLKADQLRAIIPKDQHWMITSKQTDIRSVPHPDMPAEFKFDLKAPTDSPKLNKQ
ncbi:MAG: hypothetical protein ACKVU0_16780 [Saprospiraceae bacterium]